MDSIGIVILAAGASTRLGQAKQQLQYQGQTLLQKTVREATLSGAHPVVVVIGAHSNTILPDLEASQVHVVHNPEWAEGMASTIRAGLSAILGLSPALEGVLFLLCDQPFVEASLLNNMVALNRQTGSSMVACSYQNTLGAPVLFDQSLFAELRLLQGQEGAKKLLSRYPQRVASLPFPQGAIDIDTLEDYAALQKLGESGPPNTP